MVPFIVENPVVTGVCADREAVRSCGSSDFRNRANALEQIFRERLLLRSREVQACEIQIGRNDAVLLKARVARSEEHTSELQSHSDLVCRLLLEKKKKKVYHV